MPDTIKEEDSFMAYKDEHESEDKSPAVECQSDIVTGQRDYSDWDHLSEDDRKTNSDIHEMFFVDELFKDRGKFMKLLRRASCMSPSRDLSDSSSVSHSLSSSSGSSKMRLTLGKKNTDMGKKHSQRELSAESSNEDSFCTDDDDEESEEEEDEEETLTMDRVRFNSLCILPSQLECCSLDYQEKKPESQQ